MVTIPPRLFQTRIFWRFGFSLCVVAEPRYIMQQRCLKEWCVVGRIDQDEFKNSEFRPRTTTGQYGHQNRKYLSYIAESITNNLKFQRQISGYFTTMESSKKCWKVIATTPDSRKLTQFRLTISAKAAVVLSPGVGHRRNCSDVLLSSSPWSKNPTSAVRISMLSVIFPETDYVFPVLAAVLPFPVVDHLQ